MMMKTKMLKTTLATMVLLGAVLGQGTVTDAATVAETPIATAKPKATAAPVMTDNLFKYGLKKDVELPVTVTAGGLSYTLHKIMVYDIDSPDAKAIRNKYGYSKNSDYFRNPEYFVWTKITIANNSKKVVQQNASDVSNKWFLQTSGVGSLGPSMPYFLADKKNSTAALWSFKLNPGEKLSTYKAYVYQGDFKYFAIRLYFNGAFSEKFIVNRPAE